MAAELAGPKSHILYIVQIFLTSRPICCSQLRELWLVDIHVQGGALYIVHCTVYKVFMTRQEEVCAGRLTPGLIGREGDANCLPLSLSHAPLVTAPLQPVQPHNVEHAHHTLTSDYWQ